MKQYIEPKMNVLALSEEDILTMSVVTSSFDCDYTPWDDIFLDV